MKTLVIYYSYEGTTKRMADTISIKYDFDFERLEVIDEKQRKGLGKYIWGGRQVIQKKEPELAELKYDLRAYDRIIIGTPVWASSFAPAIRTLLNQYEIKGKEVAYFYTYLGGAGHTEDDFKNALKENTIVGSLKLDGVLKNMEASKEAILNWVDGFSKEK